MSCQIESNFYLALLKWENAAAIWRIFLYARVIFYWLLQNLKTHRKTRRITTNLTDKIFCEKSDFFFIFFLAEKLLNIHWFYKIESQQI